MKTTLLLCLLWCVFTLDLVTCALHPHETAFTRRKQLYRGSGLRASSALHSSAHSPPGQVSPRGVSPAGDVTVSCSSSNLVVRVKPGFYGLRAEPEELRLGESCRSNGVLRPYGDLLFTYPLTSCGALRQTPPGYLVYKFVLHFEPSPKRFPTTAQRLKVNIECRYQRNHHVHRLTVRPTWQTSVMHKKLRGRPKHFLIELMDDAWSRAAKSQLYLLGKPVHFQVSAPHIPPGGKLYISSCYATPDTESKSSFKYTIIDKSGCMVDSRREPGASQFISRTDRTLRFSLKAFQFTSDPDTEVKIHCKLLVTSEDPGPTQKSCTYNGKKWIALTGDNSICDCCDSQCTTSKMQRAMMKGSVSSSPVLVSDQPFTAEDGFLPVVPSTVNVSSDREEDEVLDDEEEQDYIEEEEEEEQEAVEGESRILIAERTQSDVEGLVFRGSAEEEEEGSGYVTREDSSESEEEEGFDGADEISDVWQATPVSQRGGDVLQKDLPPDDGVQTQPVDSEGQGEDRNQTGRGGKDGVTVSEMKLNHADYSVGGVKTWHFKSSFETVTP